MVELVVESKSHISSKLDLLLLDKVLLSDMFINNSNFTKLWCIAIKEYII